MRTINRTHQFKKDYKRERKGRRGIELDALLTFTLNMLLLLHNDPLPSRFRDHALTGEWKDHRDCRLKPDMVLIYRLPDESTLTWCA